MPQGDGSKKKCFEWWKGGKSLKEIQRRATAQPKQVKDWCRDWRRGSQKKWEIEM